MDDFLTGNGLCPFCKNEGGLLHYLFNCKFFDAQREWLRDRVGRDNFNEANLHKIFDQGCLGGIEERFGRADYLMKFIVGTIFRKPEILNHCEEIKGFKMVKNDKGEMEIAKDAKGKWVHDKFDIESLVDSDTEDEGDSDSDSFDQELY